MSNSIMTHIKIVMIIKQVKQPLVLKVGKLMRTKKKDEEKKLMQIGYLRRKW